MASEFDAYAEKYEALLHDPIRDAFTADSEFFHARKLDLLLGYLRRNGKYASELAWLDLGCGKGKLLTMGAKNFLSAAGCDVSPAMLSESAGVQVRIQKRASEIPFPSENFDLVTAVCVYHHVEKQERAALTEEARRVLKPGGFFVIVEHNPYNPATQLIVRRCPVDVDAKLLTASESRRLQLTEGFKHVSTEFFLYFPARLYGRFGRSEAFLRWLPLGGQYASFARKETR